MNTKSDDLMLRKTNLLQMFCTEGVEGVAQSIAHEVDAEHREQDQGAGEKP